MELISLDKFYGESPRTGLQLLGLNQAGLAVNCLLLSGELRPLYQPMKFHEFACTTPLRYAFRIPYKPDTEGLVGDLEHADNIWIGFPHDNVSFLKGPLVNDLYQRYYWTAKKLNDGDEEYTLSWTTQKLAYDTIKNPWSGKYRAAAACDGLEQERMRVGVPKPSKPPCVAPEIWVHPSWMPHHVAATTKDLPKDAIGGEYCHVLSNDKWYNKGSTGNGVIDFPDYRNDGWWEMPRMRLTEVKEFDDMLAMTGVFAWDYVFVTDDEDPERNGIYIASVHMGPANYKNERKHWKFTGLPPFDVNIYLDENDKLVVDAESEKLKHRHFIRYTVNKLEDFYEFKGLGSFPYDGPNEWRPTERLDYCWNTAIEEQDIYKEKHERFGYYWAQADRVAAKPKAGHDTVTGHVENNHSPVNLVDAVFPKYKTEVVTRSYAYTYVNVFGEEGPPSDPTTHHLLDGENWVLYNFDRRPKLEGMAPVDRIRIYRTVTGIAGTVVFFYVGDMPLDTPFHTPTTGVWTHARFSILTYFEQENLPDDAYLGQYAMVQHDAEQTHQDMPVFYRAEIKAGFVLDDKSYTDYDYENPVAPVPVDWKIQRTLVSNNEDVTFDPIAGSAWEAEHSFFIRDVLTANEVSVNDPLESISWFPPVRGLRGLVAHPSGFFAAFKDKDLYFSVPYRLHAWPEEYRLTVEHPIVGLGVFGSTIIVITEGYPYSINGVRPENLSLSKYESAVPGVSFDGIVGFEGYVLFPTYDGIARVSTEGVVIVSQPLMTEEEWSLHNPSSQLAARDGTSYISIYDKNLKRTPDYSVGYIFYPSELTMGFTHLQDTTLSGVDNVQTDAFTGVAYLLINNNLFRWSPQDASRIPMTYRWSSKEFITKVPVNFGAYACAWRYEAEKLLPLARGVPSAPALNLKLWAGTNDQTVHQRVGLPAALDLLRPGCVNAQGYPLQKTQRLPAGMKAQRFRFELSGNIIVESIKLAEVGIELQAA